MLTGRQELTIKYLDAVPCGVWLCFVTQPVGLAAAAQGRRPLTAAVFKTQHFWGSAGAAGKQLCEQRAAGLWTSPWLWEHSVPLLSVGLCLRCGDECECQLQPPHCEQDSSATTHSCFLWSRQQHNHLKALKVQRFLRNAFGYD